jgi:hypothetical protein
LKPSSRPPILKMGSVELDLPIFFSSVSSVKTILSPVDYIRFLNAFSPINKQFLISAFDLCRADIAERETLRHELSHALATGMMVLMDSGNYESYWKEAQKTWLQADFHSIMKDFPTHLAFGFDEQQPPQDIKAHLQLIAERYKLDQAAAGSTKIIPIIHGKSEVLPELCTEIANFLDLPMIAVPERRLGDGLFERARTVAAIRLALNTTGRYVGLHLLGTGNPISMAIFSIAGADSFDGLEWCQTVVDHETATLYHLSQADFFRAQTNWVNDGWPFQLAVLAHNLEFYNFWMSRLRNAIHCGKEIQFCRLNFPNRVFMQCAAALNWNVLV